MKVSNGFSSWASAVAIPVTASITAAIAEVYWPTGSSWRYLTLRVLLPSVWLLALVVNRDCRRFLISCFDRLNHQTRVLVSGAVALIAVYFVLTLFHIPTEAPSLAHKRRAPAGSLTTLTVDPQVLTEQAMIDADRPDDAGVPGTLESSAPDQMGSESSFMRILWTGEIPRNLPVDLRTPSTIDQAVRTAFDRWSKQSVQGDGIKFLYLRGPVGPIVATREWFTSSLADTVVIFTSDYDRLVRAKFNRPVLYTGSVTLAQDEGVARGASSIVVIDNRRIDSLGKLITMLTHEAGHTIGLDHQNAGTGMRFDKMSSVPVMSPFTASSMPLTGG
ncbi:MAG TPA: hypothetical protein VI485_09320 [Vicinamibacterales bacterium]|nr:hypothetical protein [Vicinamibacterales bacterium]